MFLFFLLKLKTTTITKLNDMVNQLKQISNEISYDDLEQISIGIFESLGNSLVVSFTFKNSRFSKIIVNSLLSGFMW